MIIATIASLLPNNGQINKQTRRGRVAVSLKPPKTKTNPPPAGGWPPRPPLYSFDLRSLDHFTLLFQSLSISLGED